VPAYYSAEFLTRKIRVTHFFNIVRPLPVVEDFILSSEKNRMFPIHSEHEKFIRPISSIDTESMERGILGKHNTSKKIGETGFPHLHVR